MRDLSDSAHGGPRDWVTVAHHYVYVHGNIASSRVWVHGMFIHHSW